jgi:hypothetical protein
MRVFLVTFLAVSGCTIDAEVPLTKETITWPLQGGLDTKRGPLSQAPGSNIVVQDIRQERLGEWKRRDGYSRDDANTLPEAAPYFLGNLGDAGLLEIGTTGMAGYVPSLSSNRWSSKAVVGQPQQRTFRGIFSADSIGNQPPLIGFAQAGNMAFIGAVYSTAPTNNLKLAVVDLTSGAVTVIANALPANATNIWGAATSSKLVLVVGTNSTSSVYVYVADATTGVVTGPTLLSTGASVGTQERLDVRYYSGSTVTVAFVTTGTDVKVYEYNPATGTSTSATMGLAGAVVASLLDDATGSGNRFLAVSLAASVRVLTVNSSGTVLVNDLVEAVAAIQITGVAADGGAGWNLAYFTSALALRMNYKTGGVIGSPANLQGFAWPPAAGLQGSIDAQGWTEPNGTGYWRFVLGLHSLNTADPQDTWAEMQFPIGSASNVGIVVSSPAEGGAVSMSGFAGWYKWPAVRVGSEGVAMALPIQITYEDNAGVIMRHYSVSLFQQRYLVGADVGTVSMSRPAAYKNTTYVPMGQFSFYDEGKLVPLGSRTPPVIPVITPSVGAGALSSGKLYGYQWIIEQLNSDGDVWRSPPSEPALVTLSATQNTIAVSMQTVPVDAVVSRYRAALYRTGGNTSAYRRIYSQLFTPGDTITYTDLLADTAIADGEFIYTTGEIPNVITPPASAVTLALDRMWIVNQEYPTEVSYSKQLRPGRLPEFNDEMLHDLDDAFGDITAIVGLDDKVLVFKKLAVYTISGSGLDDAGGGSPYTVTRIATDVGAIPGSPVLALGDSAYFVSARGICMVDSSSTVSFMGSPVDYYLNQPQWHTPETVRAIVYSSRLDEVRFVTNAGILVYSRTFGIWMRFEGALATGSPLLHSVMINDRQWITREDGKVFVEGDATQLTDGGVDFTGILRSPYMVPSGPEGRLRMYAGRAVAQRTSGTSPLVPTLSVLFNYDDATQVDFQPETPVKVTDTSYRFEAKPNVLRQQCNAFALQLTFPADDSTWRLERWGAVVGGKPGYSRGVAKWSDD